MAHILIMPRQGNTVESCVIQEWKVKEGDTVQADTTAAVVETDKATFEVPAGENGQVLKLLYGNGDDVPVLQPIAVICAAGEVWQAAIGSAAPAAASAAGSGAGSAGAVPGGAAPAGGSAAGPGAAGSAGSVPGAAGNAIGSAGAVPTGSAAGSAGTSFASPRARSLAAREGISTAGIAGTGPGGRIIERDVFAALAGMPGLTAAAKAAGPVPAGTGAGTGLGGRVTAADRAGAVSGAPAAAGASGVSLPGIPDYGEGGITEAPVKGIRKLIADRMLSSLSEMAQFTLSAAAPAVKLQELRKRMKDSAERAPDLGLAKVTVNDLILYAVSRIIPSYPFMNALKIGDTLKTYERVHLGVAVDTPRGLMVPVIRNANLLPLRQISSEAKRLAAACQGGSVKPEELSGSTFTVTNLGSFGVTSFTPVINAPEVAILGVCGIELKPVEDSGEICFEPHIGFSLTINHQVVDGAPAARFLKALCEAVADLDLLLAAG
jgi:pyruvate dehydrogenase E2 component (dihydrolipoamide acetyltransferase)